MSGKRIAYIRVSTADQNPSRQLDGMNFDRVFLDKSSGKDRNRPELQELISYIREGDEVYVHSLDRLARNLDNLRQLVDIIASNKGATIHFMKEGITFSNQDNPMSTLLLSVMGAFAEFERALIRERQLEGIVIAKKAG